MARQKVTPAGTGAARVTKSADAHPVHQRRSPETALDEDAALVTAAGGGDDAALERLLTRAQGVAWRFSMAVCGRTEDAEDAMQEALIRTYRHVSQLHEPRAFRPWLYRTVRNACLMSRRRRKDEPARMESIDEAGGESRERPRIDVASPGRNPEELAQQAGLRRRLQAALRTLPAPYRAVVFLRDVEGLSTREVATVLSLSEDNVKTRLHRARVAMQAAMEGAR